MGLGVLFSVVAVLAESRMDDFPWGPGPRVPQAVVRLVSSPVDVAVRDAPPDIDGADARPNLTDLVSGWNAAKKYGLRVGALGWDCRDRAAHKVGGGLECELLRKPLDVDSAPMAHLMSWRLSSVLDGNQCAGNSWVHTMRLGLSSVAYQRVIAEHIGTQLDLPPKKWTGLSRSAFHLVWAEIAQG